MKHYIIIRFNYPEDHADLQQRIDLFNQYTKKSLLHQSNKNFKVLIIGNPGIDLSGLDHAFVEFKTQSAVKDMDLIQLKNFIRSDIGSEKIIITTRLDNDDILLKNFVRNIQTISKHISHDHVLETKGYFYDIRKNKLFISNRYHKKSVSPFASLIERAENFHTVYRIKHSELWRFYDVIESSCFGWLQLIHDTNQKMNKLSEKQLGIETDLKLLPDFLKGLEEDFMDFYAGDYM